MPRVEAAGSQESASLSSSRKTMAATPSRLGAPSGSASSVRALSSRVVFPSLNHTRLSSSLLELSSSLLEEPFREECWLEGPGRDGSHPSSRA